MGYRVTKFQATPNPNAMKCVLSGPLPEPIRAFRSLEDAVAGPGDPLAQRLFGVPGVVGVLLAGGWLTVNKAPSADWATIQSGVREVLLTTEVTP